MRLVFGSTYPRVRAQDSERGAVQANTVAERDVAVHRLVAGGVRIGRCHFCRPPMRHKLELPMQLDVQNGACLMLSIEHP